MSGPVGPRIEVLNTGSELLLGDVVNSHLATIATRLAALGLGVARQEAVPDGAPIRTALIEAMGRCDVLLVTGGLGPTTDDVTREVTARLLGLPLVEDPAVVAAIRERMARRGFPLRERMLRQAMVPGGATVLANPHGTAPGLYLPPLESPSRATPHLFLLPGPPRELLPMLEDHVVPMLGSLFPVPGGRMKRVYRVIGLGESAVEEMVGLRILARGDVEVGYCARSNEVDVRLMGAPDPVAESGRWLEEALGDNLVSSDGSSLEENVFRLLAGRTLALAESCTGGLVASRLTDVPGASEVFRGGIVAYSNDLKCALLDVPETLVAAHGAVSAAVAAAMAEGVRRRLAAHYALSLTGIAGPTGATAGKPVGTLHIGFASASAPPQTFAEFFPTDRITFKQLAAKRALDILRRALLSGSVSA